MTTAARRKFNGRNISFEHVWLDEPSSQCPRALRNKPGEVFISGLFEFDGAPPLTEWYFRFEVASKRIKKAYNEYPGGGFIPPSRLPRALINEITAFMATQGVAA